MKRCPNCRAQYRGKHCCHRCGMELQHLLQIESQAKRQTRQAVAALQQRNTEQALLALQKAIQLQEDPLSRALLHFLEQREIERVTTRFDTPGRESCYQSSPEK